MVVKIQARWLLIRAYTSGDPIKTKNLVEALMSVCEWVPVAQGMFHEIMPTSVLSTIRGPPLSPMQVPSPARVKVQTVLSKMRAALTALKRERQSAVVSVVSVTNCKFPGTTPGCAVCPQPAATAFTPAPTKAELSWAGETAAFIETSLVVWITEISLARLAAL